jgi:type II secretory pathway predicted ATPase ExeA
MGMALTLNWQQKLGYHADPFRSSVAPARKYLVGLSHVQEKINLFLIKEDRFGTITGPSGVGKSLLLQWIDEELASQDSHEQHKISGKLKSDAIVDALLHEKRPLLKRQLVRFMKIDAQAKRKELFQRAAKKKTVIIVDDAGDLGAHEVELLSDLMQRTQTQLIIADTKERIAALKLSLIDKLRIEIPEYSTEDLVELLRKRIEAAGGSDTHPLAAEERKTVIEKAKHNPAKLLQVARERVIELSIRAQPIQKQKGFISVKVEREHESQLLTPVVDMEPLTADAESLAEMLQKAEPKKKKSR